MSTITEAIDVQIAETESRLDGLRALREQAVSIESPAAGVPDPPEAAPAPAAPKPAKPKGTKRCKPSAPSPSEKQLQDRTKAQVKAAGDEREQIVALARTNGGGLTAAELAAELDLDEAAARKRLVNLCRGPHGRFNLEPGSEPKRYRLRDAEPTPEGPKTAFERRIVDALEGGSAPAGVIARDVKSNGHSLHEALAALVRRGVLVKRGEEFAKA